MNKGSGSTRRRRARPIQMEAEGSDSDTSCSSRNKGEIRIGDGSECETLSATRSGIGCMRLAVVAIAVMVVAMAMFAMIGDGPAGGRPWAAGEPMRHMRQVWSVEIESLDVGGLLPAGLRALAGLGIGGGSSDDASSEVDEFAPGERLARASGLRAGRPLVLVPGIVSTQLEAWNPPPGSPIRSFSSSSSLSSSSSSSSSAMTRSSSSSTMNSSNSSSNPPNETPNEKIPERCGQKYFRKRLWGTLTQFRALLLDKPCWIAHMRLDPATGLDPPLVRLRAAQGLDASDYLFPGYWVWAKLISNFAALGADTNSMFLAAYDWRLSFANLERRDVFFSRLKNTIELAHRASGLKVAVVAHSMGNLVFFYFLSWVRASVDAGGGGGGPDWPDTHLYRWVNIAGPLLGLPKTLAPMLSGETRDSAQLNSFAAAIVEQFLSRDERASLFRSWGGLASMFPKGGSAVWGSIGHSAPDAPSSPLPNQCPAVTETPSPDSPNSFSEMLTVRLTNESGAVVDTRSYDADQALEFVKSAVGDPYASHWARDWDTSIATSKHAITSSLERPETWANPLIAPLPEFKSGEFQIVCLYGVGTRTERKYHYTASKADASDHSQCERGNRSAGCIDQPVVDAAGEAHAINVSYNDPAKGIENGIESSDGDGTVPLLSLGFMCSRGWRDKRYNPSRVPVVLREYEKRDPPSIMAPMIRGTDSVDHTDIMGNHALIEDVMRATCIRGDSTTETLPDRVISNIVQVSDRVVLPSV